MALMEKDFVLGTVQLGLPYGRNNTASLCSIEEAEKILETAWQLGVRAFDTASGYGCAKDRLANWLHATGRMAYAKVVNKIFPVDCTSKTALEKACILFEGVAQLDLLVHGFVTGTDWDSFQKMAGGFGAKPGLSVYTADEVRQSKALGANLVQAPANVLDYRQLNAAKETSQRMDFRSLFLQGLLLDSVETAESRFAGAGVFPKAVEGASRVVSLKPAAALIAAILNAKKDQDRVVIGVDSPGDLDVWKEAVGITPTQANQFTTALAKELKKAPSAQLLDPRTWPV